MAKIEEAGVLPVRNLSMMSLSGRTLDAERQRQALFGHMYGPAGREFYRGFRDGSLAMTDLPRYREVIDAHFFQTIRREYSIPDHTRAEDFYSDLQGIALGVVRKVVGEAFPPLMRRLGEFKNEVTLKAPSPTTLFKVLVLPEDQVDRRLVFEATRLLLIADTAGPLYVKSRHAELSQKSSDWSDIFNEELYRGKYGAGEDYSLDVYHNADTNRVIRFNSGRDGLKPPKAGERLATHDFHARRINDYGLVYVDVGEVGVVDATKEALIDAANNGGRLQSTKDGIRIKMTFVDLEDKPKKSKNGGHNTPNLTALRAKIMGVFLRHVEVDRMRSLEPDADSKTSAIEIYAKGSPTVPLHLEFLNRRDYLNRRYDVGVRESVGGIPGAVYNGKAQELDVLRRYYPLVPHFFPYELYGNSLSVLREMIDQKAEKLKQEHTTHFPLQQRT